MDSREKLTTSFESRPIRRIVQTSINLLIIGALEEVDKVLGSRVVSPCVQRQIRDINCYRKSGHNDEI